MEVRISSSHNFSDAVSHTLAQLGKLHLKLKDEQLQIMQTIFEHSNVFVCLPTSFGKSIYHVLPFLFDHKLGPVNSGM